MKLEDCRSDSDFDVYFTTRSKSMMWLNYITVFLAYIYYRYIYQLADGLIVDNIDSILPLGKMFPAILITVSMLTIILTENHLRVRVRYICDIGSDIKENYYEKISDIVKCSWLIRICTVSQLVMLLMGVGTIVLDGVDIKSLVIYTVIQMIISACTLAAVLSASAMHIYKAK